MWRPPHRTGPVAPARAYPLQLHSTCRYKGRCVRARRFKAIMAEKDSLIVPERDEKGLFKPGHSIGRTLGWRNAVRLLLGEDLDGCWKSLAAIGNGRPIICKHPDGRELAIIPTAADVVRAATEVAHMFYGRPVDQTEIVKAELASAAQDEVRKLTDGDLVRRVLARHAQGALAQTLQVQAGGQGGGTEVAEPIDSTHPRGK